MPAVPKNGSSVSHDRPPSTVAAPKPATSSRYHGRGGAPKKGEHLPFAPSYPPSHAQGLTKFFYQQPSYCLY